MDFTKRDFASTKTDALYFDQGLRTFMLKVYNYMAIALFLTGTVAFTASKSSAVMSMLYNIQGNMIVGMNPLGYLVSFAPFIIALVFGFGIHKMNAEAAKLLFWVYATLMGLSLTSIFLMYTGESITRVFFITSALFGSMSLYGYTTKKDLTNFGSFLFMGLLGVVIASIVNIFLKSSGLHFATSILCVLIFTGLAAYDTQKIKATYYRLSADMDGINKAAILGALTLYLDFINIFVQLLQFFGDRRSN